ncbi:MAG TPA: hypothetical protein VFA41_10515 [Ktedonobacteraceae bacterium]|jgi:hypothetical protein|nr:hypothetical protein [Ktedonobacteraceae bacterium]
MTQNTRAAYEAPKLEVQRLRDLPSALAHSGRGCHVTPSKGSLSCSVSGTAGRTHK